MKNKLDNLFSDRVERTLRHAYMALCGLTVLCQVALVVAVESERARASGVPITVTSPVAGATINASATAVTGTGPANQRFYLTIDNAAPVPITVGSNGLWSTTSGALTEGSHTIKTALVEGQGLLNERANRNAGASFNLNTGSVTAFQAGLSQPSLAALDEAHDRLFVADGTPYLKVYNSQTNAAVGSINTANSVWPELGSVMGLHYDAGRSKLYVFTSFEALVVDPTTLTVTGRATNPYQNLYGIAASPTSAQIYAWGNSSSNPLLSFDRDAVAYTQLSGLNGVKTMSFIADGTKAYFQYWSSDTVVRTLNPATNIAGTSLSNTTNVMDFILNAAGDRLYTLDQNSNLKVFNTSTGTVVATQSNLGGIRLTLNHAGTKLYAGTKVYDIAAGSLSGAMAGGTAYVDPSDTYAYSYVAGGSEHASDALLIYNASGTLVKTLSGLVGADKIIFATGSAKAFVLSAQAGSISQIDTAAQTVAATITSGLRHTSRFFTLPDGSKAYALSTGGSTVQVVDPATGVVASTISLPGIFDYTYDSVPATLTASGANLYVLTRTRNAAGNTETRLTRITTATDTIASTVQLSAGFQAWQLAVDETAGAAYTANVASGGIIAINLTTGVTTPYLVGSIANPGELILSPDRTRLYVITHEAPAHVYAISTASHTIVATAALTGTGRDIVLSPDGTKLFAGTHDYDTIKTYLTKLDATTLSVDTTIELPDLGTTWMGLTMAPSGVLFGCESETCFMYSTANLTEYAHFELRSQGYNQPDDLSGAFQLEIAQNSFSFTETSTTFSIVPPPVSIATADTSLAYLGHAYSYGLSSTTATGSVTWTLESGTLPTGLNLSSGGVISGMPTAAGTSTFTVRATDSRSTDTQALSLVVWPNAIGFADDLLGQVDGAGQPNWTESMWDNNESVPNAIGMDLPSAPLVDSLRHRLYVADTANNRIMVYDLDNTNHLPDRTADHVLGQPDFTTGDENLTQDGLGLVVFSEAGLALDSVRGYLFVADSRNNRVMVYDTTALADGMNASFVLGQAGFTSDDYEATQSSLYYPLGLAFDAVTKHLYVSDAFNDRVMVFNTTSLSNGLNASFVLGQPDFTSNDFVSAQRNRFYYPIGLAIDTPGRRLFVADEGGSRVLIFDIASLSNGPDAAVVLGQPDFAATDIAVNRTSIADPHGLSYDVTNQRLFVSDQQGNRILVHDVASPTNNQPAAGVLGQGSFTGEATGTTQSAFAFPEHLWYEPATHQLLAADNNNNRVMIFGLLELGAGSLGGGTAGTAYSGSITAAGVEGIVSYQIHSGSLPPGLSLSSTGTISGTPTQPGTYGFSVRATDDIGTMGATWDQRSYSLAIAAAPAAPEAPAAPAAAPSAAKPAATPSSAPTPAPTPSPAEEPQALLNTTPDYSIAGTTQELATGEAVSFVLGDESEDGSPGASGGGQSASGGSAASDSEVHTAKVLAVGADYCELLIQSQPIHLRLTVGQLREVDVDQDGQADLSVRLAAVTKGRAQLVFRALVAVVAATPRPTPTASPQATPTAVMGRPETTNAWPWVAAGAGSLLMLGGVAWVIIRRRRG